MLHSPFRLIVCLILFLAIFHGATILAASTINHMVQLSFQQRSSVASLEKATAMQRLELAAWFDEHVPETHRLMANLESDLQLQLGHFKRLARVRPQSGQVWADIFLARTSLGIIDDQTIEALGRANALGPWEPRVQETIINAGTGVWLSLDSAMRAQVIGSAKRSLVSQARWRRAEVVKILGERGFMALVCSGLSVDVAECVR